MCCWLVLREVLEFLLEKRPCLSVHVFVCWGLYWCLTLLFTYTMFTQSTSSPPSALMKLAVPLRPPWLSCWCVCMRACGHISFIQLATTLWKDFRAHARMFGTKVLQTDKQVNKNTYIKRIHTCKWMQQPFPSTIAVRLEAEAVCVGAECAHHHPSHSPSHLPSLPSSLTPPLPLLLAMHSASFTNLSVSDTFCCFPLLMYLPIYVCHYTVCHVCSTWLALLWTLLAFFPLFNPPPL